MVACPVWRFVHTRFQISNKEFVIISMKDISVEPELKYIQAQTLKIKRIHYAVTFCFGSRSVDWMFDSLVVAITFLLFRWLVPFLFTVFFRSFSPWFHCPYFLFAAITIWQCSTATAKLPANLRSYFCCGRSGCPKLVFHWSAAWLSWPPLWWGVISFQNWKCH